MTTILGLEAGGALTTERGYGLLLDVYYIPLFPKFPGKTYPSARPLEWRTLHQESVSGKETVLGLWSFPRRQYEASFSFLRTLSYAELQAMEDFINELEGPVFPFYYDDPDDDTAVDQPVGIGDGATTQFQLYAQTQLGGFYWPIQSPVPTSVTVKSNGTPTTAFTVGAGGVLTFSPAPASGQVLTWSGTYYWLCRFDEDLTKFQKDMFWLWSLKSLKFHAVKL